jgi:hypothetical protein
VLIDFFLELVYDLFLNMSQWSELYIHQAYLLIIGTRVGVLLILKWDQFEFWYLLLVVGLLRINNMSMIITVFIRRQLFYKSPKFLEPLFHMNENSYALKVIVFIKIFSKGKHGANWEHMMWIVFLYLFWLTKSTLPFYVKGFTMISNCKFEIEEWDRIIDWF